MIEDYRKAHKIGLRHLASYDDVTSSLFCLHLRPLRPKPASSTPLRLGIILFASLSASHQEATA